ncbi:MAG: hypothetical protein PUB51_04400 [Oscillospiraceae bacterium]|nr:hypothetical protein [Oscillospiraceae bacterium]
MEQILAVLALFGMGCLLWMAYGWLLAPGVCPIRAEVTATGGGDGLEQTVKGLLWLRRSGFWQGTIAIRDGGLTREGLALALTLSRKQGVEFLGKTIQP